MVYNRKFTNLLIWTILISGPRMADKALSLQGIQLVLGNVGFSLINYLLYIHLSIYKNFLYII
jgi:hypothetical protein